MVSNEDSGYITQLSCRNQIGTSSSNDQHFWLNSLTYSFTHQLLLFWYTTLLIRYSLSLSLPA